MQRFILAPDAGALQICQLPSRMLLHAPQLLLTSVSQQLVCKLLSSGPTSLCGCMQGFILVTDSGALQICQLPSRTLLHAPWLLQKAALRASVTHLCFHKPTSHCVLLTAKQVSLTGSAQGSCSNDLRKCRCRAACQNDPPVLPQDHCVLLLAKQMRISCMHKLSLTRCGSACNTSAAHGLAGAHC